jgi:hypothetical protein
VGVKTIKRKKLEKSLSPIVLPNLQKGRMKDSDLVSLRSYGSIVLGFGNKNFSSNH